jgi:hypothetical protein
MEAWKGTTYALLLSLAICLWRLGFNRRKTPNAPGIGYGSLPLLGPWRGTIAFMKDPKGVFEKGCSTYKGGYFKFSTHTREITIVASKDKVAEYLAAPDEVLNAMDTTNEFLQTEWTLGYGVAHRHYHIALIRTKLTQSIGARAPAMLSEVRYCLESLVGYPKGESKSSTSRQMKAHEN